MNDYIRNRIVETVSANNIAYILNDNKDFSMTGYKVMQNQSCIGLLQCAKIMYNGKIKLVYMVEDYKPLSYVVSRVGLNELNSVIFNLIQCAIDIRSNGFFKAENLELDFSKIFVDISDYSVHFVYFPLTEGMTGKISAFENEFRVALISLFNSFPVFKSPVFQRLCSDLANGALTLETILKKVQENFKGNMYSKQDNGEYQDYKKNSVPNGYSSGNNNGSVNNNFYHKQETGFSAKNNYGGNYFNKDERNNQQEYYQHNGGVPSNNFYGGRQNVDPKPVFQPKVSQPVMTISSVNSPVQVSLTVNSPEFIIGKNPGMVNGAVTFNPAISRVHCKITFNAGRYYLTDLGSANGTFLNSQRLAAQQTLEIHNGDYLQLANSDFIISY